MLLLIYAAYFALRSSIDGEERRATLSAVYAVIAGVTVPFFIFVMPRIVASLHPEPIINTQGKVHMNGTMLTVFLSSVSGFTALYFWMFSLKVRARKLEYHYNEEQ
jgi:heme exporter protein C